VDGQEEITIKESWADYFTKHYSSLGYEVIIDKEAWKKEKDV
jgi:hypothetical protein